MQIFDSHAHYDDRAFKEDKNELLLEMHEKGVDYIVDIGCSMKSSRNILEMTKEYDFVYGTVGVHPDDVKQLADADMDELAKLCEDSKILAIGEIGLDYHYDDADPAQQKKWFERQLEVAAMKKMPVVIHSRDAAKDTLDVMKEYQPQSNGGVIHCFSYGVEMAREYLNMGYYIGVGGVVTFKNGRKLKEVVEYAPIDRIVLETDAPYLAPTPFRGQRNCSLYLQYVAEEIAAIKQLPVEQVYAITMENAKRMYHFPEV